MNREQETSMLDLYDELRTLVKHLEEHEVDYALCGGLAMAVYSIARATVDIDVLIEEESRDQFCRICQSLGYREHPQPMIFRDGDIRILRFYKAGRVTDDLLVVDALIVTPALETVWKTRQVMVWEEGNLKVVSREGLIEMKTKRNSGRDLDDIAQLKTYDHET